MKKLFLFLLLSPSVIFAQYHVHELNNYNGNTFENVECVVKTSAIVTFNDSDTTTFSITLIDESTKKSETMALRASFIGTTIVYDEEYVEQKWYVSRKKYPKDLKETQAIIFTRRNFNDPVHTFYWISMISWPAKDYGLIFTK